MYLCMYVCLSLSFALYTGLVINAMNLKRIRNYSCNKANWRCVLVVLQCSRLCSWLPLKQYHHNHLTYLHLIVLFLCLLHLLPGTVKRWKVGGLTIENNFFIWLKIEKRNKTFNNILKCLLVKLKLTIFTASSCRLFCRAYRLWRSPR